MDLLLGGVLEEVLLHLILELLRRVGRDDGRRVPDADHRGELEARGPEVVELRQPLDDGSAARARAELKALYEDAVRDIGDMVRDQKRTSLQGLLLNRIKGSTISRLR